MGPVGDRSGRLHAGGYEDRFGDFGFGRAGIFSVRAVNFEAVRTARRKCDAERYQFFIFAGNGARRHGRAVKLFERVHRRVINRLKLRELCKICCIEHV